MHQTVVRLKPDTGEPEIVMLNDVSIVSDIAEST
jgi:hypothetical protein